MSLTIVEKRELFKQKTIGVLMGGESAERDISLKTGRAVLKALVELNYRVVGIDCRGDVAGKLSGEGVDVAFIALHGGPGEDGCIQGMLEVMGIAYTGSGVRASAVAMDKVTTKKLLRFHEIRTPGFSVLAADSSTATKLELPVIVKPSAQGSTLGIKLVQGWEDYDAAVAGAFEYGDTVMVEKFIIGRELTVSVLDHRVLPVIEIIPEGIYDYRAKYTTGATEFKVPAVLGEEVEKAVKDSAYCAYTAIGCSGGARVDIVIDAGQNPYVLEVNTVPGLTELSLFPMAAASVGIGYAALVEQMLLGARFDWDRSPKRLKIDGDDNDED